jgi:PIN domain nuclease of toxin-antitoxin system
VSLRLLLDTHALVWALSAPARLPGRVAESLRDPRYDVHVSSVSTWEIVIKAALGKIEADLGAVVRAVREADFEELPVSIAHTQRVSDLPPHHRDPFDRLLIAQALEERLTVVTHDRVLGAYQVPILWR